MPVPEIKPNIKKVFLMNVIKIVSVAAFISLLDILFVRIIGKDFFQDVLAGLNVTAEFSMWHFTLWSILAIVVIITVVLITNYFVLGNVRYEFYPDKIIHYKSMLFVLLKSKEIPYGNIARINFDYEGFLNSLFNTGTITIELSAMKEKELKMEFIDNAEQVVRYIQGMIQNYKTRYYAQRTEGYRVDNIFNREGF